MKITVHQKMKLLLQHPAMQTVYNDFLLGKNPQRSLNYILNPPLVALLSYGIWSLGILLLVFWPQKEIPEYFLNNEIPINFLVIAEVLLLGSVYVNLICGRGEFMRGYLNPYLSPPLVTWEESRDFLKYGLLKLTIQTFLILLPFLPFLFIAASLSQVSWNGFFKGVSIILSFSLLCRLFGFLTHLYWGINLKAHYSSRFLLLAFLGITYFFAAWISPLALLYDLHRHANEIVTNPLNSYTVYLTFTALMIGLLILTIHILLRHRPSWEE